MKRMSRSFFFFFKFKRKIIPHSFYDAHYNSDDQDTLSSQNFKEFQLKIIKKTIFMFFMLQYIFQRTRKVLFHLKLDIRLEVLIFRF